jgi:hypothetical protein
MHQIVAESGLPTPEKAQHMVWRPTTVTDPDPTELGQTRNLEGHRRLAMGLDLRLDFGTQFRGDALVGVERQNPIPASQVKSAIFLRAKTGPVGRHRHLGTSTAGQVNRGILTARVEHDALIGERHRSQAIADVAAFIARNDGDGQGGHAQDLVMTKPKNGEFL